MRCVGSCSWGFHIHWVSSLSWSILASRGILCVEEGRPRQREGPALLAKAPRTSNSSTHDVKMGVASVWGRLCKWAASEPGSQTGKEAWRHHNVECNRALTAWKATSQDSRMLLKPQYPLVRFLQHMWVNNAGLPAHFKLGMRAFHDDLPRPNP